VASEAGYDTKETAARMADYSGWSDELEDEREAIERADLAADVAGGARRQLRKPYRERLLRAVVREILGRGPSMQTGHASWRMPC
jgi:hypothetical protein